ncbi:hypothetical protein NQ318_007389 [Aromia moschata]|uniref:Uncharacterized protein n=1 Tax=Aromia moschata TaxID=1265417 RepID=A0AAV8YEM2_9CUCU|nr:hypothetical protein NQ318_007389 [Aromia moschata]
MTEKLAQCEQKSVGHSMITSSGICGQNSGQGVVPPPPDRERLPVGPERIKQEREDNPAAAASTGYGQPARDIREPPLPETKSWGYSGIELMNTGAAFWQNYSAKSLIQSTLGKR